MDHAWTKARGAAALPRQRAHSIRTRVRCTDRAQQVDIVEQNEWRRRESNAPSEAIDERPSAPSSAIEDQKPGTSSDEAQGPYPVESVQATIGCNGVTSGVHASLLSTAAEWEKHQDIGALRRALLALLQGLESP